MDVDRIVRQGRWARREGIGRAFEEKDLHPLVAGRRALARARWRHAHRSEFPSEARPVWLVGLQRSGTNMVVRALRRAPEFVVHNESDRRAFRDYRLRSDVTIDRLIRRARADHVVFKPLCDSHRTPELLALGGGGRAVWLWRDVDDRVRSAVHRFGDTARSALATTAAIAGEGQGAHLPWQGEGLSPASLSLIRTVPVDRLSAASAQALLWLVRNELLFDLGLAVRSDVLVCSYDDLVSAPDTTMAAMFGFLGARFRSDLTEGIAPRPRADRDPVAIEPEIRERCDDLTRRLEAVTVPA